MGKKLQKKKKTLNQRHNTSDGNRRTHLNYATGNSSTGYSVLKESNVDRISGLPDEILLRFLSLVPFESALQTTALSKQWSALWNRVWVQHGPTEEIDCAIADFLLQFDEQNPLRNPRRLQYHFGRGLMLLATIGLKNKLHVEFSRREEEGLRQFGWFLQLNSWDPSHQPHASSYFVKSLSLVSVSYRTHETVSSLIKNFHSIESLTISKCNGLRSLQIDVVSKLQNLTVLDCPDLKRLHVEAYDLTSFRFRGTFCWFSLEGYQFWEDAMLDFRGGPGYKHYEYKHFCSLLRAIINVKTLTLCEWFFKEIITPWLSSTNVNSRFNKLKDLWWIDTKAAKGNTGTLVSFLRICPSLARLHVTIDPTSYCMARTMGECPQEAPKRPRLRRLTVVKLEGFSNEDDVIFLKEHLLEVFNVEPLIITRSSGNNLRCLLRIPNQQSNANPKVGIPYRKYSYKFVEEVEDESKHPHMVLNMLNISS